MKTFAIVSGALIVGILIVLGTEVLSQQKSNKVDVFHESLKHEQAKQIKKSIQALDAIYKETNDDYLIRIVVNVINQFIQFISGVCINYCLHTISLILTLY